nr:hypothetical protein [Bacteroidota bacterium]
MNQTIYQKKSWESAIAWFAFCFFLCLGTVSTSLNGQCTNGSAFGSGAAPSDGLSTTLTTCAFGGEYSTITGVAAATFYTSSATGGAGNYITIHEGTPGGPVIAFGFSPLSWTSTVAGTYYQHINTNAACGTDGSCHTLIVANPLGSGCTNGASFGSGTVSPGSTVTLTTCAFGGEYSTIFGVVAATTYTSAATGGTGNYITIHQGSPAGPIINFGPSPLVWTSTVAGTYYQHVNTNAACGTDGSCHAQTITAPRCSLMILAWLSLQ